MHDDSFTALKAVTGKDLTPGVAESDTLASWNVNDCMITDFGGSCPGGFTKMTGLNLDATGYGCLHGGRDSTQRSFCCPPWGPDPATCTWRGSASECYGQRVPGEVDMVADNYGGSGHCLHSVKTFCCPAMSGNAAEAACKGVLGSCTVHLNFRRRSERSQAMDSSRTPLVVLLHPSGITVHGMEMPYCAPTTDSH